MALFRKFFYRKPPEGPLEISQRVFVFGCCFTTNLLEGNEYQVYIGHVVDQLLEYYPDASFMVHNFGDANHQSHITNFLSEYGMTVINYPHQYENCPLLPLETIHHFLSSSDNWLSVGQRNMIFIHCQNGALLVLAFMLAAFLIFSKQYSDERKTLDMIYKQVPLELLQSLSSMNPLPSQLRYLEYVSRRNIDLQWAPTDRGLMLDCVILRVFPYMDGKGCCCPIFTIYGPDPFVAADGTTKVLFITPKENIAVKYLKQAVSQLVMIQINCRVQGGVVLECTTLDDDNLEHEEMMFRVMFNPAFIRSNALRLNLEEIDTLWNVKDRFPKDFRAEVLFSEMDPASSLVALDLPGTKDKEVLHIACDKSQDKCSDLDSEASETDYALNTSVSRDSVDEGEFLEASPNDTISPPAALSETPPATSKPYTYSDCTTRKIESSELQVSVQRPAQSKIISARISRSSSNSYSLQVPSVPLSRYCNATSALGITALLHDHAETSNSDASCTLGPEFSISASAPCLLKPAQPTTCSISPQHPSGKHYINSKSEISKSPPPPPPPPPPPLLLSKQALTRKQEIAQPSPLPSSVPPPPPLRDPPLASAVPPPPPPPFSNVSIVQNQSAPSSSTIRDPPLAFAVPPPQRASPARIRQVVPPPPAPLSNGLSKAGGSKAKLQLRTSTRIQAQPKKTPLKPYHWLKLTRAMQGSLWAEVQKTEEISKVLELDMSELESLFSTTIPNSDHGGKTNRRGSGVKPDKVHLIELRRAYNCEIMLTKVKVPLSDLMTSVLALDDSALDIDQVDNLIKFCPTKEEIELLKNYNGDKENLGKCEQFFLELIKVPRVESKLRVLSFKIQFCSQVSDLRNNLNIVNSASQEVRNSVKLKRIMQTILSLGNALNHGTARGSAVGFRLDSLLKLSETRSRNNKLTLIHYLCKVLAEKLPEVMDFHEDLVSLEAATKIQLKYLAEEMQAISKGLEKVVQELTASENDGAVSEHFCKTLKEFYGSAEAEVRSLASIYSVVGRNADALALYFGEDPARCPFEQVVSTLLNFVRMFRRSHEENCKQLEFEKRKAQKEAENDKAKTNAFRKELEMS